MEIAPGVHSMGGKKGGRVHAFLFLTGHELTLVDTLYETDARLVLAEIRRLGRSISDLKRIVLTHAHRSHLGGLAELKRLSGATILSHDWEADIVAGDREAQRVPMLPRRPLRVYPTFQLPAAIGLGRHPPCPVDEVVKDGDEVGPLQVLHIPGHTPGHLAFYVPEHSLLVAGDSIATWPSFVAGWPSFTLDRKQHQESIRRLAQLEPKIVGVGHGDPITSNAQERVHSLV
jgi:glyoxylase-like metal-dependent hydrolase (beta-lactamase superfamily II)